MDPMLDRAQQMDSLFEALVQPIISPQKRQTRIDGAIATALGSSARLLKKGADFVAFKGKTESVLRGTVGTNGAVVIEGVNLAAAHARKDADALVSRLLRIMEGPAAPELHVVIGYVASPGGLNGETDMRDWLQAKITPNVFDLVYEASKFQSATMQQLQLAGVLLGDAPYARHDSGGDTNIS
jgi:hypothetical protein